MEGGGEGPYLVTYLSRKFGPVYVLRGKMPTFPNTYAGNDGRGLAVMPDAQTQYWSLVSCEAVPSGQVVDGITDFQVPLDEGPQLHDRCEPPGRSAEERHARKWRGVAEMEPPR